MLPEFLRHDRWALVGKKWFIPVPAGARFPKVVSFPVWQKWMLPIPPQ